MSDVTLVGNPSEPLPGEWEAFVDLLLSIIQRPDVEELEKAS